MNMQSNPADAELRKLKCPHCGKKGTLMEPHPFSSFICTECEGEAWIHLHNEIAPPDGIIICAACSNGYHEHHRQSVFVFNKKDGSKDIQWGEPDCKNTFPGDKGYNNQCFCWEQPHGNTRKVGYNPYSNIEGGWSEDQPIPCIECITIVEQIAHHAGRGIHLCDSCGQKWEVTNNCSWSWPWPEDDS